MSNDDDFDERLKYAPPWARQAAARPPAEPYDDHPVDLDQHRRRANAFDGDVALREMRERLALDPAAIPGPPLRVPTARPWRTAVRVSVVSTIVAASGFGAYLLASTFLKPSSAVAPPSIGKAPAADARPAVKSDRGVITALAVDASSPRVAAPAEPTPPPGAGQPAPPAMPVTAPAAPPPVTVAVAPNPTAPSTLSATPVPDHAAPEPIVAAPPGPPLDREEIATLLARGRGFIANGDIAAARLLLRRAADAGDASAALMLGSTFDPTTLRPLKVIGTAPDVEQARKWYRRAAELGSAEAGRRLDELSRGR
ncbi:SEL1-like repeat protein [Blastochloris viridis]|nr:SEL1-like repeat protein [Blastochloris viridis]ALK10071.1 Sel1 repeat protein [Blastochloris viridis]CUU42735.1 Sel1 repeat [Blastochloris viridis]